MLVEEVALLDPEVGAAWPQPPRTTSAVKAPPVTHTARCLGMDLVITRTLQMLREDRSARLSVTADRLHTTRRSVPTNESQGLRDAPNELRQIRLIARNAEHVHVVAVPEP